VLFTVQFGTCDSKPLPAVAVAVIVRRFAVNYHQAPKFSTNNSSDRAEGAESGAAESTQKRLSHKCCRYARVLSGRR
jgi:hypothetical protein